MRRMLVVSSAVLAALALATVAGASTRANVTVAPAIGRPSTTFTVSFTAPDASGHHGFFYRQYTVSVQGPRGSGGCHASAATNPPARAGQRVRSALSGQPWCAGVFRGRVEELKGPYCKKGKPCPEFVTVVRTLGKFSFRVRANGSNTTPPDFAGLESATQCIPGPQRPHERRPVNLGWDAATPSSGTMYEIFISKAPGDENFSKPNWTTGKLSFTTPKLPPNRYFVVRARDKAGIEDHNRVEHRALNPCV